MRIATGAAMREIDKTNNKAHKTKVKSNRKASKMMNGANVFSQRWCFFCSSINTTQKITYE